MVKYSFLENFSKQTTIHGLHILGLPKLYILERLFWVGIVTAATGGALAIAYSNWTRYLANPTVVSLKKDFRNWENPFPAVTGCFVKKTDDKKVEQYIFDTWEVKPSDDSYERYLRFVALIANTTYANLNELEEFRNDPNFNSVNMFELSTKVHPKLSGTLVTFDPKQKIGWILVLTELGVCFSFNSKFSHLFTFRENSSVRILPQTRNLKCHYLNGLCYGRYDSDPNRPLNYYVHSYMDIVHYTIDPPLWVRESEELEINYRMQQTESSSQLRSLSPSQRQCRFDDEPPTFSSLPAYSTSICYVTCRYRLALKLCGCRPFFYQNIGNEKVCDITGLLCLARHAKNITLPPTTIGCKCPQPCEVITYFPQIPKYTKWEYGYFDQRITFRWGLLPPTTKFRRDVIFGFEDLVVSFGGTLALFLGLSFISLIEAVFLIVENLLSWRERKKVTKSIKSRIISPKTILIIPKKNARTKFKRKY